MASKKTFEWTENRRQPIKLYDIKEEKINEKTGDDKKFLYSHVHRKSHS
jgi:hypothetical protein